MGDSQFDAVVVGAGHNGLVAATYLAKAGKSVLVLEAGADLGGATASVRAFPDYDVQVSRFSYLVSLLPDKIIRDLGLQLELRSRDVSSYTPTERGGVHTGLFVGRSASQESRTAASFLELTGSDAEYENWKSFGVRLERFAEVAAPLLLEPLRSRSAYLSLLHDAGLADVAEALFDRPIGEWIESTFSDDLVRGVVATDALIGVNTYAYDPTLLANRCFFYHVVGNGTGEWKVPVGGMGRVVSELRRVAEAAGVQIRTNARVKALQPQDVGVHIDSEVGRFHAGVVLCNAAPRNLARLLGKPNPVEEATQGTQMKVNVLLERLPQLRSGENPVDAFAGTFHIDEGYTELAAAYTASNQQKLPDPLPAEVYCHSLTDPSIMSADLQAKGFHTLTLFGLHTPAELFAEANDEVRSQTVARYLAGLNRYLVEPIENCIARDASGALCIEAKTPLDLDNAIGLPRGHIFHRDLSLPFVDDNANSPVGVGSWGVETEYANIYLCGAGAMRGGGVSGIPGHNAAMAVLSRS